MERSLILQIISVTAKMVTMLVLVLMPILNLQGPVSIKMVKGFGLNKIPYANIAQHLPFANKLPDILQVVK